MTDQDTAKSKDTWADGSKPPIGGLISDRWELVAHIGEGGMSDVYKARHVIMNKFGAVKFLKGSLAEDPLAVKRFQQEATASATLSHPNIVQVYDCGLSEYGVYLIMEFLQGVSLAQLMEERSNVSEDGCGLLQIAEAVLIFLQICSGLEHAHNKGIVHRDIKPTNVMLIEPEEPKSGDLGESLVKLVDFGLAKIVGKDGTSKDGSLTRTGELFGSPLYMSPEQCLGRPLDGRADIYSLGCVMYECVTGRNVLVGLNVTETMLRRVEEEADLRGLFEMKHPLARPLALVIQNCLRRNVSERYENVDQVRSALMALDKGGDAPDTERRLGPLSYLVIACCLVLAVGIGLVMYSLWPVASHASADSSPISIPHQEIPPKSIAATAMSQQMIAGGVSILVHVNTTPERKKHTLEEVLKRSDDLLDVRQYADAEKGFDFVLRFLSESEESVPNASNLLLHAQVGSCVAKSEMHDLDQLDISLGNLIKNEPSYFNASNKEKCHALQWRAKVQRDNGSLAAAAITIKKMLDLYADQGQQSDADKANEITQSALWTGLLADLLRLTGERDSTNAAVLEDYARAIDTLNTAQISDTKFATEVLIFKARLYYRYGLALNQAHKLPEAYAAFQRSLAIFSEQGGRLEPEVEGAKVQSYLTLKQFDWLESLKYRLQNHL